MIMEQIEKEIKKTVVFGWVVLIALFIVSCSIMMREKKQTEKMYTNIPCPKCESKTVYCLGHDDVKEQQEFKCMTCKTKFIISDYD